MEDRSERIRLNLTSKLILAAAAALGLGVVVSSAPTDVAASARTHLKPIAALRPLSSAPGIRLSRAQGADDEDCVSVAPAGGATPNRLVCAR